MPRKAIIIGAGPAGLTAAYELLKRTDIVPIILEKDDIVGGISRTINYKGNRMDMGPHRFFSKSDRVMSWWLNIMPLEEGADAKATISYQNKTRDLNGEAQTAGKDPEKRMLLIQRLTRIYFLRKFFAYPIQLSLDTLRTLGLIRTIKILISFLWIRLFPRKPEKSLEDFIINKFGRQLYLLFFKDYTEKVWGIAPSQISAEWGAQRIKGVSLSKAIGQAIKSLRKKKTDIAQKSTETSLIEQFLYPKHGPGSLWEDVARQIQEMGGKIYMHQQVQKIHMQDNQITSVTTVNTLTGHTGAWEGDFFFSTMPVQELIAGMSAAVPKDVQEVAAGLQYRDFINVGILLKQLSSSDGKRLELKDNWIYIQERDVKVGRLMIYNNWGNGMIKDPNTTWIGMEYFCNKTDDFWALSDDSIQKAAIKELEKMELATSEDILDITVRRMEKTYPAYFGTYTQFDKIKDYINQFENLFLIGRNGMHKYNNADHSMLCSMVAVDNILSGETGKANLWAINTEQEYQEEKSIKKEPVPNTSSMRPSKSGISELKSFITNNSFNNALLKTAFIAIITQFIIFKILYPFAGFIDGDSYVYLQSAYFNMDINTYPIGYSKFLRLISALTKSDTALVFIQYFLVQCSALLLMFTLFYFFRPRKGSKLIMFIFLIFNPIFLYISNYISSDSLFLSLSLIWFTTLLWILKQPTNGLILTHAAVLLLAFTVRYNALYYPLISIPAFIFSRQSFWKKSMGIGISILAICLYIGYVGNKYYKLTGTWQFSPFTGWQMANNALNGYRFVESTEIKTPPDEFKQLDNLVRKYFDNTQELKKRRDDLIASESTMYMWDPRLPLQVFMRKQFKTDSLEPILKKWSSMGPLYARYGSYLIRQYPISFFNNFVWPNMIKFYTPPEEFLSVYNMGEDSVHPIAKEWFNYRTRKVYSVFKTKQIYVLRFLPIVAGAMHIVFLLSFLFVALLKKMKMSTLDGRILALSLALWFINFGFSVFASPITLRYQLFPILTFAFFSILLVDIIYSTAFSEANQSIKSMNTSDVYLQNSCATAVRP